MTIAHFGAASTTGERVVASRTRRSGVILTERCSPIQKHPRNFGTVSSTASSGVPPDCITRRDGMHSRILTTILTATLALPVVALAEQASKARRSISSSESCRSEEHTSELQSQSNLVCRLLLEKKN